MYDQIKKLTLLLLATAILAMCACIVAAVQQFQISTLRKADRDNLEALHSFQTSQYNFDKAVTERLKK